MENEISNWSELIAQEAEKTYFKSLMTFLNERRVAGATIFPAEKDIFCALNACSLTKVKVVILGQDPYPTAGHANGLSFSVAPTIQPFPRSLTNIFKELEADLAVPFPINGDLTRWANQGVLLLNNVLTVEEGIPNSHAKKGWEIFTSAVIETINSQKQNVVYLLWGKNAHQKAENVNVNQNFVLKTSHPSPLGYMKRGKDFESFLGSKCFSRTNNYLQKQDLVPISW